jgi:hypothetical protein
LNRKAHGREQSERTLGDGTRGSSTPKAFYQIVANTLIRSLQDRSVRWLRPQGALAALATLGFEMHHRWCKYPL